MKQAVAALLNASHRDIDYPLTRTQVIHRVDAVLATADRKRMLALAESLASQNAHGCSLH